MQVKEQLPHGFVLAHVETDGWFVGFDLGSEIEWRDSAYSTRVDAIVGVAAEVGLRRLNEALDD